MSLCRILAVSGGYFARLTWACTALYHSSTLLLPCLKCINMSNLTCTSLDWGLQNSWNLSQIVSSINWSVGKPQDTYLSMPMSPDQAITFLFCCLSGNSASLHSRMFSHFRCHFKNLWYKPLPAVHLGSLNVWHKHTWDWLWLSRLGNVISGSGSCSELDCSSWLLVCVSWGRGSGVVPQAELFVALSILGLCLEWSGFFQNYTTTGFLEQTTHKLRILIYVLPNGELIVLVNGWRFSQFKVLLLDTTCNFQLSAFKMKLELLFSLLLWKGLLSKVASTTPDIMLHICILKLTCSNLIKVNFIFHANAIWLFLDLIVDFQLYVIQFISIKDKFCLNFII